MMKLTRNELMGLREGLRSRVRLAVIDPQVMLINDDLSEDSFLVWGEEVVRLPHAVLLRRVERLIVDNGGSRLQ